MNLLIQLLLAAALITVMIVLRLFSYRRVTRLKMKCESGGEDCSKIECFHGCGGAKSLRGPGTALGN